MATTFATEKEQLKSELQRDAIAAQAGDADALARIWEDAIPVCDSCAKRYLKRYEWLDAEELAANLLADIPRILARYDPRNNAAVPWGKYLYHRLDFAAKDHLRSLDPLGMSWPKKKMYPHWAHFSDTGLEHLEITDHRESIEPDELAFLVELAETEKVNDSIRDDLDSFVSSTIKTVCRRRMRRRLAVKARFSIWKFKPVSFRKKYIHSIILAQKKERRVAASNAKKQEAQREKERKAAEREALRQERALLPKRRRRGKKPMETTQATQAESQPAAEQQAALVLEPVQHGVMNGHAAALPASQPVEQPAKKPPTEAQLAWYAERGRRGAAARHSKNGKRNRGSVKSGKQPTEMDAFKLLSMAIEFSQAAGGLKKAIQLLEQANALK